MSYCVTSNLSPTSSSSLESMAAVVEAADEDFWGGMEDGGGMEALEEELWSAMRAEGATDEQVERAMQRKRCRNEAKLCVRAGAIPLPGGPPPAPRAGTG